MTESLWSRSTQFSRRTVLRGLGVGLGAAALPWGNGVRAATGTVVVSNWGGDWNERTIRFVEEPLVGKQRPAGIALPVERDLHGQHDDHRDRPEQRHSVVGDEAGKDDRDHCRGERRHAQVEDPRHRHGEDEKEEGDVPQEDVRVQHRAWWEGAVDRRAPAYSNRPGSSPRR